MTLLLIGGTSTLGRQIIREALKYDFPVRCVVRNKRGANFLDEWGTELVYGNLTTPETLPLSFEGVTAIIDASTSRSEDDSKMIDVDWYGKLLLFKMAKSANIKRFIFFSIIQADLYQNIALMEQKAHIEKILSNSDISYTVFQYGGFYQALINQYAIPILEEKIVWKTSESISISCIDTQNAAKICIKSLSLKNAKNKFFFLEASQAKDSENIINLCEILSGQKAQIKTISIGLLKLLRQITGFFEWLFKIYGRLVFVQVLQNDRQFIKDIKINNKRFILKSNNLLSLKSYFSEYFEMMLITLENLDIDSQKKQKDLII